MKESIQPSLKVLINYVVYHGLLICSWVNPMEAADPLLEKGLLELFKKYDMLFELTVPWKSHCRINFTSSVYDVFNYSICVFVCAHVLKVAAGTLDASTKIYAVRVDAVHADAYRVLGGLGAETKPGEGESLSSVIYLFSFVLLEFYLNTYTGTWMQVFTLCLPECKTTHVVPLFEHCSKFSAFCFFFFVHIQAMDRRRRKEMKGPQEAKWLPSSRRKRGLLREQSSRTWATSIVQSLRGSVRYGVILQVSSAAPPFFNRSPV